MKYKQLIIIFAGLFVFLLTGCTDIGKASEQESIQELDATQESSTLESSIPEEYMQYIQRAGDRVKATLLLNSGDLLVIEEEEDYYWVEIYDGEKYVSTLEYDFTLLSMDANSGTLREDLVGTGYNEIPFVSIFYQKDGEQYSTDCANYKLWPLENPTDVLIMVYPDPWSTGIFEESQYYEFLPTDNLDTVPVCIQDAEWRGGFPVWVFDVPYEDIMEDYRLEYADYVLTGKDILSFNWSPETGRITP